jgi:hypothetical protein
MKSANELAELLFDLFRNVNSREGGFIPERTYGFSLIMKLNPKEQELLVDVTNKLIDEGYIIYEPEEILPGFRLTKKGYDQIYNGNMINLKM